MPHPWEIQTPETYTMLGEGEAPAEEVVMDELWQDSRLPATLDKVPQPCSITWESGQCESWRRLRHTHTHIHTDTVSYSNKSFCLSKSVLAVLLIITSEPETVYRSGD